MPTSIKFTVLQPEASLKCFANLTEHFQFSVFAYITFYCLLTSRYKMLPTLNIWAIAYISWGVVPVMAHIQYVYVLENLQKKKNLQEIARGIMQ